MLFIIGFLVTFLFGGLTGVILASPPLDFHVSDTYFLVAHFHYVLFGTVVFTMFGGFYFWWPKFTGKKLDETLGKWHFWTLFIGFWMTFLVQHWLGVQGMPRRVANYPFLPGTVTTLNQISSIGSWILGVVHVLLPLQRLQDLEVRGAGHRRRPVGLRELAGMGDLLPAAAAQLHPHPAHPLRAARVRPALPRTSSPAGPGHARQSPPRTRPLTEPASGASAG